MVSLLYGNSKLHLRRYSRYKGGRWGDFIVNEIIAWYAPGPAPEVRESEAERKKREEGRAELEAAIRELGMKTATSEDVEDLRLLLSGQEPVLLLAELGEPAGWSGWRVVSEMREGGWFCR